MKKMLLSSIFTFVVALPVWSCQPTNLNSCRDSYANYLKAGKAKRAVTRYDRKEANSLRNELHDYFSRIREKSDLTESQLFADYLSQISYFKKMFLSCVEFYTDEDDIDPASLCQYLTLEEAIYTSYGKSYLDATAATILLMKLKNNKKSKLVGSLNSYINKSQLLRKSFLKNRELETISDPAPLSQKKYLASFSSLRRMTPRQNLLLKYNYTQIKYMGKMLQKMDERMRAMQAGLFYDYDGDGQPDEMISIDSAEQYRMTVKLLNLELEKESYSTGVFAGKKPEFMDLLAAASELGLIDDLQLKSMVELPSLYEDKRKEKWKLVGEMALNIVEGVLMVIPGVNLYAIIPIVVVESYFEAKELKTQPSNLHLF